MRLAEMLPQDRLYLRLQCFEERQSRVTRNLADELSLLNVSITLSHVLVSGLC